MNPTLKNPDPFPGGLHSVLKIKNTYIRLSEAGGQRITQHGAARAIPISGHVKRPDYNQRCPFEFPPDLILAADNEEDTIIKC